MIEVRQPIPSEAQRFKVPASKVEKATDLQTTSKDTPSFWELLTGSVEGSKPRDHLNRVGELYEQWGTGNTKLENFMIGWRTGVEAAQVLTSTLERLWSNPRDTRDPCQSYHAPTHELYESRKQAREASIEELRVKAAL